MINSICLIMASKLHIITLDLAYLKYAAGGKGPSLYLHLLAVLGPNTFCNYNKSCIVLSIHGKHFGFDRFYKGHEISERKSGVLKYSKKQDFFPLLSSLRFKNGSKK